MPSENGNGDMSHEDTESTDEAMALTPRQATAALELSRGKSVTETARAAGVSRQTLYTWMREPEFIAWLNRWQSVVLESVRSQLMAAANEAAATLANAARHDYNAAAVLLRGMGGLTPKKPGSGNAQFVARQIELTQRGAGAALDRHEAELDDFEQDTLTGQFGDADDGADDDDDDLGPDRDGQAGGAFHQRVIAELEARRARAAEAPPPAGEPGAG